MLRKRAVHRLFQVLPENSKSSCSKRGAEDKTQESNYLLFRGEQTRIHSQLRRETRCAVTLLLGLNCIDVCARSSRF